MTIVDFELADSSPCLGCGADMPLELLTCTSCGEAIAPRGNVIDFLEAFSEGHIIDVRPGGLVLGRHNNVDDIPMVLIAAPGVIQVVGMMQGGEYIVNREATAKHRAKIEEINSYKNPEYTRITSITISQKTRVFNTNGISGDLSVLIGGGQFVINRGATNKHLLELEEINNSVAHELTETTTAPQPPASDETGSSK
jgi:hypothetical protein